MDHEDREEIPWSSLVAEMESGVDRRWWLLAGALVVVVLAFIGYRALASPGGQPPPLVASDPVLSKVPGDTTTVAQVATTTPAAALTEEDLRAGDDPSRELGARARAEWFVADFYTVDGSVETAASVRRALAPTLADQPLPHDDADAPHTFVEWARVVRLVSAVDPAYVYDIAYRSIAMVDGVFVRRPVRAVRVTVAWDGMVPLVVETPEPRDDPWEPSF